MCGRDRKKFKLFPVEGKQPPSSRESLLDVSARDNDARVLGWGRSSDVCEQRRPRAIRAEGSYEEAPEGVAVALSARRTPGITAATPAPCQCPQTVPRQALG